MVVGLRAVVARVLLSAVAVDPELARLCARGETARRRTGLSAVVGCCGGYDVLRWVSVVVEAAAKVVALLPRVQHRGGFAASSPRMADAALLLAPSNCFFVLHGSLLRCNHHLSLDE